MMGAVRGWLMAVIAVSLLCAVADALMPPGAVRRAGKLVCGLVLLGTVLSPVAGLDAESGQRWLDGYLSGLDSREEELEKTVNGHMKGIIEQRCAAYIVDKAEEMGIPCQAEVTFSYDEDGVPCPWEATARGVWTQEGREAVGRLLEDDLGIPPQRQHYEERLP